jgi:hypothetical protein
MLSVRLAYMSGWHKILVSDVAYLDMMDEAVATHGTAQVPGSGL